MNHTPAAALKAGFAAIEQYGSEAATTRGPWTDLYALAAVIYAAITGSEPAPAADRLANDRLRPLAIVAAGLYSARFLTAIDAAMAVQPKQRPADHTEFRALMGDIEAPEAVSLAPRPDLMQEPFGGAVASAREVTVPDRPLLAGAEPARGDRPPPSRPRRARPSLRRQRGSRRLVRRADASNRRDAVVDEERRRARPARQARALRRRRRHVRVDRHRRARPPVRHAQRGPGAACDRGVGSDASASRRPRLRRADDRDRRSRRRPRRRDRPRDADDRATAPATATPRPRRPPSPRRDGRDAAAGGAGARARDAGSASRTAAPPTAASRTAPAATATAAPPPRRPPRAPFRPCRWPRPHRSSPRRRRNARRAARRSCRRPRSRRSRRPRPTSSSGNANERLARPLAGVGDGVAGSARRRPGPRAGGVLFLRAADLREGARRGDRQPGRADRQAAGVPGPPRVEARQARSEAAQAGGHDRSDARHDHRPADRDDGAVRAARHPAHRQPLPAVPDPAVPGRQPVARPVPAHRHDVEGADGADRQADGAPRPRAARPEDRPGRRPGVGAGARGEPRQHAVALLPRQPGADQGQGRRRLREDGGDAGRAARRRLLPRADRRRQRHQRSDLALQRREVPGRARHLPHRAVDAAGRAAARAERHLPVQHEARPASPRPSRRSAASSRSAWPTTSSA